MDLAIDIELKNVTLEKKFITYNGRLLCFIKKRNDYIITYLKLKN